MIILMNKKMLNYHAIILILRILIIKAKEEINITILNKQNLFELIK